MPVSLCWMRTVRSIEKQTLHGVDFDNILVSDNMALSECDNLGANTKRSGIMEMDTTSTY